MNPPWSWDSSCKEHLNKKQSQKDGRRRILENIKEMEENNDINEENNSDVLQHKENGDIAPVIEPDVPKVQASSKQFMDQDTQSDSIVSIFRRKVFTDQNDQNYTPPTFGTTSIDSFRKQSRNSQHFESQEQQGQESRRNSQKVSGQECHHSTHSSNQESRHSQQPLGQESRHGSQVLPGQESRRSSQHSQHLPSQESRRSSHGSQKSSRTQPMNETETKEHPTWVSKRTGKVMKCKSQQTSRVWEFKPLADILQPFNQAVPKSRSIKKAAAHVSSQLVRQEAKISRQEPRSQASQQGAEQPKEVVSWISKKGKLVKCTSQQTSRIWEYKPLAEILSKQQTQSIRDIKEKVITGETTPPKEPEKELAELAKTQLISQESQKIQQDGQKIGQESQQGIQELKAKESQDDRQVKDLTAAAGKVADITLQTDSSVSIFRRKELMDQNEQTSLSSGSSKSSRGSMQRFLQERPQQKSQVETQREGQESRRGSQDMKSKPSLRVRQESKVQESKHEKEEPESPGIVDDSKKSDAKIQKPSAVSGIVSDEKIVRMTGKRGTQLKCTSQQTSESLFRDYLIELYGSVPKQKKSQTTERSEFPREGQESKVKAEVQQHIVQESKKSIQEPVLPGSRKASQQLEAQGSRKSLQESEVRGSRKTSQQPEARESRKSIQEPEIPGSRKVSQKLEARESRKSLQEAEVPGSRKASQQLQARESRKSLQEAEVPGSRKASQQLEPRESRKSLQEAEVPGSRKVSQQLEARESRKSLKEAEVPGSRKASQQLETRESRKSLQEAEVPGSRKASQQLEARESKKSLQEPEVPGSRKASQQLEARESRKSLQEPEVPGSRKASQQLEAQESRKSLQEPEVPGSRKASQQLEAQESRKSLQEAVPGSRKASQQLEAQESRKSLQEAEVPGSRKASLQLEAQESRKSLQEAEVPGSRKASLQLEAQESRKSLQEPEVPGLEKVSQQLEAQESQGNIQEPEVPGSRRTSLRPEAQESRKSILEPEVPGLEKVSQQLEAQESFHSIQEAEVPESSKVTQKESQQSVQLYLADLIEQASESQTTLQKLTGYLDRENKALQTYSIISIEDGMWLNRKTGKVLVSHTQQTQISSRLGHSKIAAEDGRMARSFGPESPIEGVGPQLEELIQISTTDEEKTDQDQQQLLLKESLPSSQEVSGQDQPPLGKELESDIQQGSSQELLIDAENLENLEQMEGEEHEDKEDVEQLLTQRLSEATLEGIAIAEGDNISVRTYSAVSLEEGSWVNKRTGRKVVSQHLQTEESSFQRRENAEEPQNGDNPPEEAVIEVTEPSE